MLFTKRNGSFSQRIEVLFTKQYFCNYGCKSTAFFCNHQISVCAKGQFSANLSFVMKKTKIYFSLSYDLIPYVSYGIIS